MEPDGNCRRRNDGHTPDDDSRSSYHIRNRECCAPQIFTSVLLGLLACVLVTGGVFLAFHKWDHTWLLVSAVGVILMAIGTALHCCSSESDGKKGHRCKGPCGANRCKPDVLSNGIGGMLSEQLVPLSNARSVSQLSLNMVPGYFPPIVYPAAGSPYGLEQHSTVVQNISKLVQHQQQLHLQSPTANQDSKSFILFPLPVDANATNIQNIVAAVCQLDNCTQDTNNGSQNADASDHATETSAVTANGHSPSTLPGVKSPPILKHVEVQTCNLWTQPPDIKSSATNTSTESSTTTTDQTSIVESLPSDFSCQVVQEELQQTEPLEVVVVASTEVDETLQTAEIICDMNIPNPTPSPDSDIPSNSTTIGSFSDGTDEPVLTNDEGINSDRDCDSREEVAETNNGEVEEVVVVEECAIADEGVDVVEPVHDLFLTNGIRLESSLQSLSDLDSLERSSPPPSYEDVTQRSTTNCALNAFGSNYGTL